MAAAAKKQRPKKKNPFDLEYGSEVPDHYKWTQTETEVVITVLTPPGTKAKDVHYVLHNKSLECGVKGKPPLIKVE